MLVTPAAHATDESSNTGDKPAYVEPYTDQALDKMKLVDQWAKANEATESLDQRVSLQSSRSASPTQQKQAQTAENEWQKYERLLSKYEQDHGAEAVEGLESAAPSTRAANSVAPMSLPVGGVPAAYTISLKWFKQQNSYYCGPATAQIILNHYGKTKSHKDVGSKALSQKTLASSTFLNTDAAGETSSWNTRMPDTLNKWRTGKAKGSYILAPVGTTANVRNTFQFNVPKGIPFAVTTAESASGEPYNGHKKNTNIYHWLTAIGYKSNGSTWVFADSVAGLSGYGAAKDKFSIASSKMHPYMKERNYVW